LEFRLQAVGADSSVLPPKGGTPNGFASLLGGSGELRPP